MGYRSKRSTRRQKVKVTCKTNKIGENFSTETASRLKRYISIGDDELKIEIGKEYVVYGIELWDNCPWLYICAETYDEYPKPFALDFLRSPTRNFHLTGF